MNPKDSRSTEASASNVWVASSCGLLRKSVDRDLHTEMMAIMELPPVLWGRGDEGQRSQTSSSSSTQECSCAAMVGYRYTPGGVHTERTLCPPAPAGSTLMLPQGSVSRPHCVRLERRPPAWWWQVHPLLEAFGAGACVRADEMPKCIRARAACTRSYWRRDTCRSGEAPATPSPAFMAK